MVIAAAITVYPIGTLAEKNRLLNAMIALSTSEYA